MRCAVPCPEPTEIKALLGELGCVSHSWSSTFSCSVQRTSSEAPVLSQKQVSAKSIVAICCLNVITYRMVGVGRDLCGSSSPTLLPKQGHLQQAVEDLVQAVITPLSLSHGQEHHCTECCVHRTKGGFCCQNLMIYQMPFKLFVSSLR